MSEPKTYPYPFWVGYQTLRGVLVPFTGSDNATTYYILNGYDSPTYATQLSQEEVKQLMDEWKQRKEEQQP